MRYNILLPLIFIFIAGCIDPDTPNRGIDSLQDVQTDRATDVQAEDIPATDIVLDTGHEAEVSFPKLSVNAPDDSIYLALKSVQDKTVTVEIRANNIKGVGLLSFRVKYDPSVLHLTKVVPAPLFGQADKTGVFMARDMKDGMISLGGAYFGLKNAVDFKDDLVATLTFSVLQTKTAKLSFPAGYVLVLGKDRSPVPVTFLSSSLSFVTTK